MGLTDIIQMALSDFQPIIDKLLEKGAEYGPQVIISLAVLVVGWFIARICQSITKKILAQTKLDKSLINFFARIIFILVLVMAIVTCLQRLGVEPTSIFAALGALSLAVGLALQGSLSNFAAGIILLILRPFKLEDYIASEGIEGYVKDINLFSTELATVDNLKIIVPNSKLSENVIKNFSSNRTRRIDLSIGISYGSSVVKAKALIEEILKKQEKVLNSPEWLIAVGELADSSVNLVVRVWVKRQDYWDIRFHLLNEIKTSFDANGIEIPFPQRVVHMKQVGS